LPGNFRAIVYAEIDPLTGKPRYLREIAKTYADAKVALTKLQRQVDEKRHPRTNITISQVIAQWLEVAEHEDTTRERYEDLIRLYITPTFGAMLAGKLDAELLEKFYARLQRCRELCNGRHRSGHTCRPLANNTIRKLHFIFTSSFDRAVRWKQLGVNEAAMAQPPAFQRSEPDPPSPEEVAALLNEAWTDPDWGLLLWLTMVTGSRRGEICALRWCHVDLERAIVWVEKSNAHTKNGVKEKRTKNGQHRRVNLAPATVALLAEHREHWKQRCASVGCTLDADAFVFSLSPDGSAPLLPHSVTQRYRRLAMRLKLRSTRLHALRHYTATELIAAGVDVRTVAGRLGHGSGGATTLRVYAAWVDEADRKAATTIETIMPTPDPSQRAPRSPYEKIAAAFREDISTGRLRPGDQLPTYAEIAVAHNVAIATAQRAVALLRTDGLVEVARGRRATVMPMTEMTD